MWAALFLLAYCVCVVNGGVAYFDQADMSADAAGFIFYEDSGSYTLMAGVQEGVGYTTNRIRYSDVKYLRSQITNGDDDWEINSATSGNSYSRNGGTWDIYQDNADVFGMIYTLNIPQGSSVLNASQSFRAQIHDHEHSSGTPTLTVYAANDGSITGNCDSWDSCNAFYLSRTAESSSFVMDIAANEASWMDLTLPRTSDFGDVVEAVLSLAAWQPLRRLVVMWKETGTCTGCQYDIETYNGVSGPASDLFLAYREPSADFVWHSQYQIRTDGSKLPNLDSDYGFDGNTYHVDVEEKNAMLYSYLATGNQLEVYGGLYWTPSYPNYEIYIDFRTIDMDPGEQMYMYGTQPVAQFYRRDDYLALPLMFKINGTTILHGGYTLPGLTGSWNDKVVSSLTYELQEESMTRYSAFNYHPYNFLTGGSEYWHTVGKGNIPFASFDTGASATTIFKIGYRINPRRAVAVYRLFICEGRGTTENHKRLNVAGDFSYSHNWYVPGKVVAWTAPKDIVYRKYLDYDLELYLDDLRFPNGYTLQPNRRYFIGLISSEEVQVRMSEVSYATCTPNMECYDYFWYFQKNMGTVRVHEDYDTNGFQNSNPFGLQWRDKRQWNSYMPGVLMDIRFDNSSCYTDGNDCYSVGYSNSYLDGTKEEGANSMTTDGSNRYHHQAYTANTGKESHWFYDKDDNKNPNSQTNRNNDRGMAEPDEDWIVSVWAYLETAGPIAEREYVMYGMGKGDPSHKDACMKMWLDYRSGSVCDFKVCARHKPGADEECGTVTYTSTHAALTNKWVNFAMRYESSGETLKSYVDFVEVASMSMSSKYKRRKDDGYIGTSEDGDSWSGKIGRVFMYSGGSASEVPVTIITDAAGSGPYDYNTFPHTDKKRMPQAWVSYGSPKSFVPTTYPGSPPGVALAKSLYMTPTSGADGYYIIGGEPHQSTVWRLSPTGVFSVDMTNTLFNRIYHMVSKIDQNTFALYGGYDGTGSNMLSDLSYVNIVTKTIKTYSNIWVGGAGSALSTGEGALATRTLMNGCIYVRRMGGWIDGWGITSSVQDLYLIPQISNITESGAGGCVRNVFNDGVEDCIPPVAPYEITIHGEGFGYGFAPTVTIDYKSQTVVTYADDFVIVSLTTPVFGSDLPVTVTACNGHFASESSKYGTTVPLILPGTSRIDLGPIDTTHEIADTKSSHALDFDIDEVLDINNVVVVLNGPDGPRNCPVVIASSSVNHIKCTLPPLVGIDITWYIYETFGVDSLSSETSTDSFSYVPPEFLAAEVKFFNTTSSAYECSTAVGGSCSHLVAESSIQLILQFTVSNLGVEPGLITSTFGPSDQRDKFDCTILPLLMDLTPGVGQDTIYCSTPLGNGKQLTFEVIVGGVLVRQTLNQTALFSPFEFSFPDTPVVTKVSGCGIDIGNTTSECPTVGGTQITVFGDFFDSGPTLFIEVDSKKCTNPVYDSFSKSATCNLPFGTGYNKSVVVSTINSVGGVLVGDPFAGISYGVPVIQSIDGCAGMDSSGWAYDCNRTSNEPITLHGYNFGQSSAVVLVGGLLCKNPSHTVGKEHFEVICNLPDGRGLEVGVVLSQQYGEISGSGPVVSYLSCVPGFEEPTDGISVGCVECTVGTYSLIGISCSRCPNGKFGTSTGLAQCDNCPIGHFSFDGGVLPMDSCQECPTGKFASTSGSDQCLSCPLGTFTDTTGNSQCLPCDPGFYQDQVGGTFCLPCSPGTYSDIHGADQCSSCVPGKFQSLNSSDSCDACPTGTFSSVSGSLNCTECLVGTFQPLLGQPSCDPCPRGKYVNATGYDSCLSCDVGQYQDDTGQLGCKECQAGTFNDVTGASLCEACDLGTYQNLTGTTSCVTCPEGTFTEVEGAVECEACPPGTQQVLGVCQKCVPGQYQPLAGQTECEICPKGTFASEEGATVCELCLPGEYGESEGLSKCNLCSKGTFSVDYGRTSPCEPCPVNTYTPNFGDTRCHICTGGPLCCEEKDAEGNCIRECTGRSHCDYCKPGTYARILNGTVVGEVCLECPDGVDCDTPGFAFAKEGWWLSILPENSEDGEPGSIKAFKCLPGRCVDAEKCFTNGVFDADAVTYPVPTLPPNATVAPGGTAFGQPAEKEFEDLAIIVGQNLACCQRKEFGKDDDLIESNRLEFSTNPMCGKCQDDYYEWGNECLECTAGVNWSFILIVFLLSWGALLIFHAISQSTRAETKIFFYFIQMALLFFGSNTPWLSWLNFINFNSLQSASNVCVAKMGPAAKLMINIWMPFVGLLELLLTMGIHFVYWVVKHKRFSEEYDGYKMRKSPYIRTACAMALFFYNNVTQAVFEFFKCVPIGNGESVVETYPALVCNSPDYVATAPLIYFFLITVTISEPILIAYVLYRAGSKKLLTQYKFLARYGVLYETYRPEMFWWEMIPLVRRTVLIAVSVSLASNDFSLRMTVLSILNLVLLMMHIFSGPFTKPVDNISETFSLTALLLMTVGLINVDLPLSEGATYVFALLVFSPLLAFVLFQGALRFIKYGWPDTYKSIMHTQFMGSGIKGFMPHDVSMISWAANKKNQEGNFWDNVDQEMEQEDLTVAEEEIEMEENEHDGEEELELSEHENELTDEEPELTDQEPEAEEPDAEETDEELSDPEGHDEGGEPEVELSDAGNNSEPELSEVENEEPEMEEGNEPEVESSDF